MGNACGQCGEEDCDPVYVECCSTYMCDRCAEAHEDKWGLTDEE